MCKCRCSTYFGIFLTQWGLKCLKLIMTWALSQYKDRLSQVWDSHVKDKTVARPSYLLHGDPYTDKTTSLYWDDPEVTTRVSFNSFYGYMTSMIYYTCKLSSMLIPVFPSVIPIGWWWPLIDYLLTIPQITRCIRRISKYETNQCSCSKLRPVHLVTVTATY